MKAVHSDDVEYFKQGFGKKVANVKFVNDVKL